MRRFLIGVAMALSCFSGAPAFAGNPGALSIVLGSSFTVPLGGTMDIIGTVTNLSASPVAFDTGGFTNLGGCTICFGLTSLIDNTNLSSGQSTTSPFFLFSVHNLGAPGVISGQFQLFDSLDSGIPLGTSNLFTVQTVSRGVPEPATLLLLGAGLAGLGGLTWRRHRRG